MNTDLQRMADLLTDIEGILADGQAVNMLGFNVLIQLVTTMALNLGVTKADLLRVTGDFYDCGQSIELEEISAEHLH